ncbi:hypothetical protein PGB34_08700 [Xenophilus arseniciresistens]|uniref:Uncharacterized protein n=1 Tax=Xenophilus arseniciresistens TaxID=1283306 RepID=A0AAE3NB71_9BURK|nr:hypothetical protein [Xenophilus arseniciresistens]MDA7416444.1 hypothetical protein [Xenophilus arseniciresistens]
MKFELPAGAVQYLGRAQTHMRTKKDDSEVAAGSIIPLVSQTALGISNSTFEVQAVDASEVDIPKFREDFPVLETAEIGTRLMTVLVKAPAPSAVPAAVPAQ